MPATRILGLCGFRCAGKSEVRRRLSDVHGLSVFDTDSVPTGDPDANQISADEVLSRYGGGESYFHFLKERLEEVLDSASGVLIVDSLKARADKRVLRQYFPSIPVQTLWIHAPFTVREARYTDRDVLTGRRTEALRDHDANLVRLGLAEVCLDSDFVISNVFGEDRLGDDLDFIVGHLTEV